MLTVEQVKAHSEISLGHEESKGTLKYLNPDRDWIRSMARLLYVHNERASKMRIICGLPESIPSLDGEKRTEDEIKETIDWEKFTRWINRHDDLSEDNLVTPKVWSCLNLRYSKQDKVGRNGLLDTIRNEVIDCNKIVLLFSYINDS